jgi:flagellar FliL protein
MKLKESIMAEEKAPEAAAASHSSGGGQKPVILYVLAIVNMAAIAGLGYMMYVGKKKDAAQPKLEHVIEGEHKAQEKDHEEHKELIGKVIPLETFFVNLAGSKGRRVAKISMEIEIDNEKAVEEIDKRKAQIRDIIIMVLSSKTYEEVSSSSGKDSLRGEIRDTINSFLVQGKISNVFFTDFIYN